MRSDARGVLPLPMSRGRSGSLVILLGVFALIMLYALT